jgi:hypothetical protein
VNAPSELRANLQSAVARAQDMIAEHAAGDRGLVDEEVELLQDFVSDVPRLLANRPDAPPAPDVIDRALDRLRIRIGELDLAAAKFTEQKGRSQSLDEQLLLSLDVFMATEYATDLRTVVQAIEAAR